MFESWFQEHYHEMSGAGQWFRGSGLNLLAPSEWERRRYRVLIVRLSTARDCADSFTHQLLYQIAASVEGIFPDCAFLPPPEDGELFDLHAIPWMTGVVSKRPAADFDCIAISNSIVQELINIPTLLRKSGIPTGKRDRIGRSDIPIIILGGANALFASALCCDSPAVDAVFAGEDASLIQSIFTAGRDAKRDGGGKPAMLAALRGIPGIVEPDRPEETRKSPFPLSSAQQLSRAPVFSGEGKIGVGTLQISEGCPCFCTFCAESWSRKPYREADADASLTAALAMKASMGLDRIDLYSFNFNMHGRFKDLLYELAGLFAGIGLKSQRIDAVADDPELLKILHAANKSSITVGIEGVSERLRASLQKSLGEMKLRTGLARLLHSPLRELKLFFLATGREEDGDIDEFRNLLAYIAETMEKANRQPRIIVSMTPMVRFPFTPLEREAAPDPAALRKILQQCERLTHAKRFEFRAAASMNEYAFSQLFVRALDSRAWYALDETVLKTGFVYYRDISDAFMDSLLGRLQSAGLAADRLLRAEEGAGRLPVQGPIVPAFIETVRRASASFQDIGYCLGSEKGAGACVRCGACGDESERIGLTSQRPHHPLRGERLKERFAENATSVPVRIKCMINASQRGLGRGFIAAEIARVFMAASPLLLRLYRGFRGSLVAEHCESDWIHGEDVLTLLFQEKAASELRRLANDRDFVDRINAAVGGMGRTLAIDMETSGTFALKLCISTVWKCDPGRYCREQFLKHTLVRDDCGWMVHQFTRDSIKKHLLLAMKTRHDEKEWFMEIAPGGKFGYNEFLRSAIDLPTPRHLVRVSCEARIAGL